MSEVSVKPYLSSYYRPQTKFAKVMFSQVFVCPWGGGSLSRGVSFQRRVSVRGVSVQGGLCQGDIRMVKSGRYASYWNAFLFLCLIRRRFVAARARRGGCPSGT